MASSGILRRVALVRTDGSEELSAYIIRVTRICERNNVSRNYQPTHDFVFLRSVRRLLVTANITPSSLLLVILIMEALRPFETFFLTRPTRLNNPEDAILHSHRRENLKSYMPLSV
jgi:hypothetical protein